MKGYLIILRTQTSAPIGVEDDVRKIYLYLIITSTQHSAPIGIEDDL